MHRGGAVCCRFGTNVEANTNLETVQRLLEWCNFTNWDERCAKASISYSEWCKRVEDLEREPDRARTLRKSLSSVGAKIEVQLVTSCKSHKPPGEIKFSICWPRNMVRKTTQKTVEAVPYLVQ